MELYVSAGPGIETKRVPNVLGQTVETAMRNMVLAGFHNVEPKEVDSDQPKGTVVEQSAKADTLIESGRKIILSVSRGPKVPSTTQPVERTISYRFPLPEHSGSVKLSILCGDEWIVEDETVGKGVDGYDVTLTGMGSKDYSIYIDGDYIETVTVEF